MAAASFGPLQTSSGLPFRRLNFVPARRADAHSAAGEGAELLIDLRPSEVRRGLRWAGLRVQGAARRLSIQLVRSQMPSMLAAATEGVAMAKQRDKPFCGDVQLRWATPRKAVSFRVAIGAGGRLAAALWARGWLLHLLVAGCC